MSPQRKMLVAAVGAVLPLVWLAGMAWACTPTSTMALLGPQASAPGSSLTVAGKAVQPGPLEIRWNSVTGSSLPLATVEPGPSGAYDRQVTVPADAAPGVYYMALTAEGRPVARVPFEVTATAGDGRPGTHSAAPSLRFAAPEGPTTAVSSSRWAAGVALLAVGFVVLSAGFGVAAAVRRRAPVDHLPQ